MHAFFLKKNAELTYFQMQSRGHLKKELIIGPQEVLLVNGLSNCQRQKPGAILDSSVPFASDIYLVTKTHQCWFFIIIIITVIGSSSSSKDNF